MQLLLRFSRELEPTEDQEKENRRWSRQRATQHLLLHFERCTNSKAHCHGQSLFGTRNNKEQSSVIYCQSYQRLRGCLQSSSARAPNILFGTEKERNISKEPINRSISVAPLKEALKLMRLGMWSTSQLFQSHSVPGTHGDAHKSISSCQSIEVPSQLRHVVLLSPLQFHCSFLQGIYSEEQDSCDWLFTRTLLFLLQWTQSRCTRNYCDS